MKRLSVLTLPTLVSLFLTSSPVAVLSCTIAVVSGSATTDGRPILWKNRGTDWLDQEVRYFDDGAHGGYIAIVSTGVDDTTTAYVGVNDDGFAVMNSNAPDLFTGSPSRHGIFMKRALRECGSVADFEALLQSTSGSRGHIWANFGVIDRFGNAAIFETNDWAFVKYDAASEGGFVLRSNFSFWGGGTPETRYERAHDLISEAIKDEKLDHAYVVSKIAKDIGGPPSMPCGQWPTIDPALSRYRTRSAAVVHGVLPGEDSRLSTFWCMLGEPSCAAAVPLWSCAGAPPPEMSEPGERAPMCAEILEKELYCYNHLETDTTIDTDALVGDDGLHGVQGYSMPIELEAFEQTAMRLADWRLDLPSVSAIAAFQSARAGRTYLYLDGEVAPGDGGRSICDIDVAGTRSGSYSDTWKSDGVCESIEEVRNDGSPDRRFGYLEHKWIAFVEPGAEIIFHLEADHTGDRESDDYVFSYSLDDVEYNDLLVVKATSLADIRRSVPLPASTSGNVYVRVMNTGRRARNRAFELDSIVIDYLAIESRGVALAALPATADAGSFVTAEPGALVWDAGDGWNGGAGWDGGDGGQAVAGTEGDVLLALHRTYPNPLRGSALFRFDMPETGWVTLQVFDAMGRRIFTPMNELRSAGRHSIAWNGQTDRGRRVTSGVYFLEMRVDDEVTARQKLVIID